MAEEQDIDFKALFFKLWEKRLFILKWMGIAAVVGLLIGFTTPKEYTCFASLAPEFGSTKAGMSSSLTAYAQLMGVNLSSSLGSSRDAVYPDLYPDIVYSTTFMTKFFNLPVSFKWHREVVETNLYDYLQNYQKNSLVGTVVFFPFRVLGWAMNLFKPKEEEPEPGGEIVVDDFKLTYAQSMIVKKLRRQVKINVDKKTYVVQVSTTMQDPVIAALVTRQVLEDLKRYITDYRIDKSRKDLEYTVKLFEETKADYEKAHEIYARYMDSHQGIVSMSGRVQMSYLQNDSDLAYNLYNQVAQRLQLARAKVQEETPVFKTLQPPVVPIKKSSPSKVKILFVMLFLAFCGSSVWVLWGEDFKNFFRKED